ncbi:hypothetical protein FNW02_18205 [Komarekiella sp. 'clone 1']|uniref:Uncharacterized protein n=1 Tax=Komarekiella delphini-convector SJRDD-AB1 TaxID=2593771 RepID=A0AA40SZ95_9NOST|nr:hypothetical protein [Komarekiella delphini-convector]MBD6617710.1 hypothetical protein [Komarekiella delphini-convector SJRDD-AB1]
MKNPIHNVMEHGESPITPVQRQSLQQIAQRKAFSFLSEVAPTLTAQLLYVTCSLNFPANF